MYVRCLEPKLCNWLSIIILCTTPSQFQTWLEVEVSYLQIVFVKSNVINNITEFCYFFLIGSFCKTVCLNSAPGEKWICIKGSQKRFIKIWSIIKWWKNETCLNVKKTLLKKQMQFGRFSLKRKKSIHEGHKFCSSFYFKPTQPSHYRGKHFLKEGMTY